MLSSGQSSDMIALIDAFVDLQIVEINKVVLAQATNLTAAKTACGAMFTGYSDNMGMGLAGRTPITTKAAGPQTAGQISVADPDSSLANQIIAIGDAYSTLLGTAISVGTGSPAAVTTEAEALKAAWLAIFNSYADHIVLEDRYLVTSKAPPR